MKEEGMTIEWGRDIPVTGKPAWLHDDQHIIWISELHPDWQRWGVSTTSDSIEAGRVHWGGHYSNTISAIRLPADHFAYKALDAGFEPWGGQDAAGPVDWDGGDVLRRDGRVTSHYGAATRAWVNGYSDAPEQPIANDVIGYHKKENTVTDEPTQAQAEALWDGAAQQEEIQHVTDERNRLMQELAQTRAQRDMAGQAAAHWIGRYYAQRAAHGDIPALNVTPLVKRELQALEAAANPQQQADG